MKKRLGFVSNSSSSDYYVSSRYSRYSEEEITPIVDVIEYGDYECQHFFVRRSDYNEERKDKLPIICIKCGCFSDWNDIDEQMMDEYNVQFNMDEEISASAFSFFKNPYAEERFKNGIKVKHDINELIIL